VSSRRCHNNDHLHRVGNDLVRAKTIDQIRHLTHDDSKTVSAAAMKLITTLNPDQTRQGTEAPRWTPAVSPQPRHIRAEEHDEGQVVTSPILSHPTARSGQPELEAWANLDPHTEATTKNQPSHYARGEAEEPDATGTVLVIEVGTG
jgi:hypothetical protein